MYHSALFETYSYFKYSLSLTFHKEPQARFQYPHGNNTHLSLELDNGPDRCWFNAG